MTIMNMSTDELRDTLVGTQTTLVQPDDTPLTVLWAGVSAPYIKHGSPVLHGHIELADGLGHLEVRASVSVLRRTELARPERDVLPYEGREDDEDEDDFDDSFVFADDDEVVDATLTSPAPAPAPASTSTIGSILNLDDLFS